MIITLIRLTSAQPQRAADILSAYRLDIALAKTGGRCVIDAAAFAVFKAVMRDAGYIVKAAS